MMQDIAQLREKYDLHMRVERYRDDDENLQDKRFIRSWIDIIQSENLFK